MTVKIKFLGTRGSYPVDIKCNSLYGTDTTCNIVTFDDKCFILDCGSGAIHSTEIIKEYNKVNMFISHPHFDHNCGGINVLSEYCSNDRELNIYGSSFGTNSVKEYFSIMIKPPLWPVTVDVFPNVFFHDMKFGQTVVIDDVTVTTEKSNHPGGCSVFRFAYQGFTLVYAIDFNHADGYDEFLVRFADKADVLIYDGSMSEEEYREHSTWGHSTPLTGCKIAEKAEIGKLFITHHSPKKNDDDLSREECQLKSKYHFVEFAKQNNEFTFEK